MQYRVYVFDFDGTIIDSNHIKSEAYYDIFDNSEDTKCVIGNILGEYPELNRYDTIKKICNVLSCYYGKSDEIASTYSRLVFERVVNAPMIKGAQEVLELLKKTQSIVYLSSNTPVDILNQIVKARKFIEFFSGVFGYPDRKNATLKKIMKNHSFEREEYLVIGDGKSDEDSAHDNGVDFFKVENNSLVDLYTKLIKKDLKS